MEKSQSSLLDILQVPNVTLSVPNKAKRLITEIFKVVQLILQISL